MNGKTLGTVILAAVALVFVVGALAATRDDGRTQSAIIGMLLWAIAVWAIIAAAVWVVRKGVSSGLREARGQTAPVGHAFPVRPVDPIPASFEPILPTLAADAPGLYVIRGVDKATKMDTTWRVRADSEANARVKAELEGIVPTSVVRERA